MNRTPFRPARAALAALAAAAACGAALAADESFTVEQVARGKQLVSTSGCMDCHTPFAMGPDGPHWDPTRTLAGHPDTLQMPPPPPLPEGPWQILSSWTNTAFAGPWGVSFTANLTPDPDTGLGRWTSRDFVATFRTSRRMGRGRPIQPPMPIPVYRNFSDEDLTAIFAYLRTLPPVKNKVPEPWAPPAAAAK